MLYASRFTITLSKFFGKLDAGLILAAVLSLFVVQALLKPGLPTSADLPIHIYRALEYERAWAAGVIAPRWAPNLAYGYGYPLFIFAPPLPYFLAMLFHGAGLTIETAFKILLILTTLLYASGMYLFARDTLRSVSGGLVAAAAFTFAPFALREALLYGGNLPQYLAIGLFPWPLWSAGRAYQTGRWGWTVLAGVFYAAIMLSHLFQAFIFFPIFGSYLVLLVALNFSSGRARLWQTVKPLLALPIGLLLSAFFWIPAFIERSYTRAQASIYLEKSPFFIRYPYWPELTAWIEPLDSRAANPYVPLTLGVITLLLAALGLLAAIVMLIRRQPVESTAQNRVQTASIFFFALLALAASFMTLPASQRVWEIVSILQVSEFPWRMLGPANLGLAFVAGAALHLVPSPFRKSAAALCLTVQLIAVAPYLFPTIPFTHHGEPTIAAQIRYERSSQSIGTTTLGEYLPQTVPRPPNTSPLVDAFEANRFPERLDRASLPSGATATLLEQSAVTFRYRLETAEPFTLRLFQFDFPGWRADLNGQPLSIEPESDTGLILVDIPAGQHILTIHFGETPVRLIGLGLTGLTLAGLVIAGLFAALRSSQNRVNDSQSASPPRLRPTTPVSLGLLLIAVIALWLMPHLEPLFTIDSPPEKVLPAQHQTDLRFANGIRLVGYDLSRRVVRPGDYLQVVLYWQTDSAPHRVNLRPFVHLDRLDDFTTVADATNYTPGDVTTETNMPTFHWDNARYVRDEHDLIIPASAPPQAYAVRVGLIDPDQDNRLVSLADGSGDTAWIDTINIAPGQRQGVDLEQPLDVEFSNGRDAVRLTGLEIEALTPDQLRFRLAWRSDERPQADYTVFTQLLDAEGQLVAGFDRPPLDGAYPTSTWLPRLQILDPRYLPLEGTPPGRYTLIAGLYDSTTGQRLTTPSGADFVELAPITIEEQ